MGAAVFALFAALALGAAVVVVAARRIVTSALALIVCFLAVAGLFFLQGAEFLGAVQILLYAGSIVVLFVFVVMMMSLSGAEEPDWRAGRAAGGAIVAAAVLAELGWVIARSQGWLAAKSAAPAPDAGAGHVETLGRVLFREYLLPFEILSVVLLAALFGVLVIGRGK